MTENTPPTTPDTPAPGGRVEPVDLQAEMQRSYLEYAMSVIVGRALPEVRDGLKLVHTRVLYAMYDGGYRPDRGYSKCSRVVGDVMGQYHPHGDTAIYDTLVRLAQPWSIRYPLVDGQGNFGSPGNDPAAAMRYCVAGDTRVRTYDGGTVRIADIVPDADPDTDHDIDLKLLGKDGNAVHASKLFHSGTHPTRRIRTRAGDELTGTPNHPVLCLVNLAGIPTLLWKLLEEIGPGDRVVMQRSEHPELGDLPDSDLHKAVVCGGFVSEGFVSPDRAGFNDTDKEFFGWVLDAFDAVVGGPRYVRSRVLDSGSTIHELDVHDTSVLRHSVLADMIGNRSADKVVPEFVWRANQAVKATFLRALFTGDGSCSALPRRSVQVSYSTRSDQLARDVRQLLLEFGIVSSLVHYANGEHKVVIGNRRDARLFSWRVGFLGRKQVKLEEIIAELPRESGSLSGDHVPHLAQFLRRHGAVGAVERHWLERHNVDRLERWEQGRDEILTRITPEAAAVAEPLVDGRFYYAEVVSVEDAGPRPVYSLRVDSADHAFVTNGFVSHNTECRLTPLAMEMVRDIDEDTVDFRSNYDGRGQEPVILPSRFPNMLANGSTGIAVGMATNIPPHNLREIASGVRWALEHPDAPREELLDALLQRVHGPDFPTAALIVGRSGIEDAYRTGRGSITMRAVVDVEEDKNGRTCLVVTELPYQVNPENLAYRIAELADAGKVAGIADVRDHTSTRTGQRLVVVLKRDAVAKVVLNNLFKHTQLQDSFPVNMLALVDGVPRTLTLDQMVSYWIDHQIEVIQRRTRFRLRRAQEDAHLQRALVKALDALDEVIALIRASQTVEDARDGLMRLLEIDEVQARNILDMQLRRLSALERQRIIDRLRELEAWIADLEDILASPERQRSIVGEELGSIVDRFGDDRRTQIIPAADDLTAIDLIPDEEVVVTITLGGYAKRTRSDLYRSQHRGGRGVRGASLRGDDVVGQLFVTRTHHWILFFTNQGRVYRARAYELPEAARDARGGHVAGLLSFQPGEEIAKVLAIPDYDAAPYLVLATRRGLVKKTPLTEYDSNRAAGIIALTFRGAPGTNGDGPEDELIGAELVSADDELLLVSRKAQAVRFRADDAQLRPMGRVTSGVTGMRFRPDDELLSMAVIRADTTDDPYVFTVTDGGYAKRTRVSEYRLQGRGGLGIKAMRITEARGSLVGAMVVRETDRVLCVKASGQVTRSPVADVAAKGRDTMGVIFAGVRPGDSVVAIARNTEDDAGNGHPEGAPEDGAVTDPPEGDPAVDGDRTDSQEDGA